MVRLTKRHSQQTASLSALLACALFCACIDDHPDTVLVAVFAQEGGTVTQQPAGSLIAHGTNVRFTAIPDSGFVFTGWDGSSRGYSNPLELTVRSEINLTARFSPLGQSMTAVRSAGQSFTMGSTGALAAQDERPAHTVRFSYDYYIGATEITQANYAAVMGATSLAVALAGASAGAGDSLPVYGVSWYDAVRYCNARSRAEGFDTVYSYSAVCAAPGSCPYILENVTVHYDRFGYRLPTEAEWEYACRAGSSGDYYWGSAETARAAADSFAWYSANAADRAHEVARKRPNAFGLYDMSGNVSEWVNDWLAPYADSTYVDPVGPRQRSQEESEATYERPVRGGCWKLGDSYLRSSARRGPYATAAYTATSAIGFRVALGAFSVDSSTQWRPGAVDSALGVRLVAPKSQIASVLGTSQIRVVFTRWDGARERLYFIDYSSATPAISVFPDTIPVICPVISPDGQLVAYGSRREGFATGSRVSVRSLAGAQASIIRTAEGESSFLPRWWTDPVTRAQYLIYTNGASLCNSALWRTESTYKRAVGPDGTLGPLTVLTDAGSYHGGLSTDGRFVATGFPRAFVLDVEQNNPLQYFVPPGNGFADTVQVCNVSISPSISRPDEILLLDFGTNVPNTVVGSAYDFHEVLFRCNSSLQSDRHISRWYWKPTGFDSWNDVEWSNHPNAAAGLAYRVDSQAVYALNLEDSTYVELARGSGLRDPYVWIDPAYLPQIPDQYAMFGRYDIPALLSGQVMLTGKLRLYWKRRASLEGVFAGSSSVHYGIDPLSLSRPLLNMGTCSADHLTAITLISRYALTHSPNLKVAALALDAGFLRWNPNPQSPFLTGIGDSKGHELDKQYNYWRDSIPAAITEKISRYGAADWPGADTAGRALENSSGGWGVPLVDDGDYSFDDSLVQLNLGLIAQLADTLAAKGVYLLIVNFPENPGYAALNTAGRYGPSIATFAQVDAWVRELAVRNPFVLYYDAHSGGSHDYGDADAMDANHLSPAGAVKLGGRIDSLLTARGVW